MSGAPGFCHGGVTRKGETHEAALARIHRELTAKIERVRRQKTEAHAKVRKEARR